MKADQLIRVEVRYSSSDELERARNELFLGEAQNVEVFDGTIEATVQPAILETLKSMNLLLDFPHEQSIEFDLGSEFSPALMSVQGQPKEESSHLLAKAVSRVRKQSKQMDINPETFVGSVRAESRVHHEPLLDGLAFQDEEKNLDLSLDQAAAGLLKEDAYTIKFNGPMQEGWRIRLRELDVSLSLFHKLTSPYTYTSILADHQLMQLKNETFIRSVRRYGVGVTLGPGLRDFLANEEKDEERSVAGKTFDVILHDPSHLDKVMTFISSSSLADDISSGGNIIRFKAKDASTMITALASLPYVSSIDFYEPPKLFCDVARKMVGIQFMGEQSKYAGEGEIVAVFDSGVDDSHPDLLGNVAVATSYGSGTREDRFGHGTHVASTICGTGAASDGAIKGMAPKSKIVSVGIVDNGTKLDLPVDLGDLMKLAVERGAKIINLSWGHAMKGDYHNGSYSIDQFAYSNPEVLIVVAAGNDGQALQSMHRYKTIGVPGTAKNVLTVGAATSKRKLPRITEKWGTRMSSRFPVAPQKDELVVFALDDEAKYYGPAATSSRGPTDYDSIKPEVIAPGTYILAAKANGILDKPNERFTDNPQYTFKTGTSMATPIVSGLAALVREFLRKEHNCSNPSSSLVKAILIACANPVKNSREVQQDPSLKEVGFPDFDQGYGLINVQKLLDNSGFKLLFEDIPNASTDSLVSKAPYGGPLKSSRQYDFEFNGGPLSVVLTWLDPPAKGVQNNLQLSLATPDYKWELGNMAHVYKKSAFFDSTPGALNVYPQDKYNTVEKISIQDAPIGKYRVKVMAQSTVSVSQGYSLVVLGNTRTELAATH